MHFFLSSVLVLGMSDCPIDQLVAEWEKGQIDLPSLVEIERGDDKCIDALIRNYQTNKEKPKLLEITMSLLIANHNDTEQKNAFMKSVAEEYQGYPAFLYNLYLISRQGRETDPNPFLKALVWQEDFDWIRQHFRNPLTKEDYDLDTLVFSGLSGKLAMTRILEYLSLHQVENDGLHLQWRFAASVGAIQDPLLIQMIENMAGNPKLSLVYKTQMVEGLSQHLGKSAWQKIVEMDCNKDRDFWIGFYSSMAPLKIKYTDAPDGFSKKFPQLIFAGNREPDRDGLLRFYSYLQLLGRSEHDPGSYVRSAIYNSYEYALKIDHNEFEGLYQIVVLDFADPAVAIDPMLNSKDKRVVKRACRMVVSFSESQKQTEAALGLVDRLSSLSVPQFGKEPTGIEEMARLALVHLTGNDNHAVFLLGIQSQDEETRVAALLQGAKNPNSPFLHALHRLIRSDDSLSGLALDIAKDLIESENEKATSFMPLGYALFLNQLEKSEDATVSEYDMQDLINAYCKNSPHADRLIKEALAHKNPVIRERGELAYIAKHEKLVSELHDSYYFLVKRAKPFAAEMRLPSMTNTLLANMLAFMGERYEEDDVETRLSKLQCLDQASGVLLYFHEILNQNGDHEEKDELIKEAKKIYQAFLDRTGLVPSDK